MPSTATPIARANCNEVLTIPEARPASARGTFAIAIVSSGMNASPAPRPISRNGDQQLGK